MVLMVVTHLGTVRHNPGPSQPPEAARMVHLSLDLKLWGLRARSWRSQANASPCLVWVTNECPFSLAFAEGTPDGYSHQQTPLLAPTILSTSTCGWSPTGRSSEIGGGVGGP